MKSVSPALQSAPDACTQDTPISSSHPRLKPLTRVRKARFERRLPRKLVIGSTLGNRSLHIQIELESTSDSRRISTLALVDSGATSLGYADGDYVQKNHLPT